MYFDFEDYHPETPTVEAAISRREGILLSISIHCVLLVALVILPKTAFFQRMEAERQAALQRQVAAEPQERPRFVFVQPRVEIEALQPPPRAELSDRDRNAAAPERADRPTNAMPFSRGNSSERVDAERLARARERGDVAAAPSGRPDGDTAQPVDEERVADAGESLWFSGASARSREATDNAVRTDASPIGDALRDLERYVTPEVFQNLGGGGGQPGATIQFDNMGVEFGPWLRRFVAQVRRNWFIPIAASTFNGHVVITFNVHRSGAISELTVLEPSSIQAFAQAAYNALLGSNPTYPLPPEYPVDRAFFTVTFYYNETPPAR